MTKKSSKGDKMFIFVNPKTNKLEFSLRFKTLKEALEKRNLWGYDSSNLWIKLEADWKRSQRA
jgi:hypothetical protein